MTNEDKKIIIYLLKEKIKDISKKRKEAIKEGAVLHWTQEILLIKYKKLLSKLI